LNKSNKLKREDLHWTLGENEVFPSPTATHLGILRAESKENEVNVTARLSLARRTMYSLLTTGFHGSNGLNPAVSLQIYRCYVVPRLLFGLEVLPLNKTQITTLSRFHIQVMRRIQSLPERTATSAVYMLLGSLPIEAELHKRQLSFLHNVLICNNTTINDIAARQIAVNIANPLSYFCRVSDTLTLYNLPPIETLQKSLHNVSKLSWKVQVRNAVNSYWTETLTADLANKSTPHILDEQVRSTDRCNTSSMGGNQTRCARSKKRHY